MCLCICACVSMLIERKRTREKDGWMDGESREVCAMSVKNKGKYERGAGDKGAKNLETKVRQLARVPCVREHTVVHRHVGACVQDKECALCPPYSPAQGSMKKLVNILHIHSPFIFVYAKLDRFSRQVRSHILTFGNTVR
jgi:hypothetical protein